MKKRLSLLMVLVMVLSLLPLSAFATANVVYTTADLKVSEEDASAQWRDVSFNLRFVDGTIARTGKFTVEFSNGALIKELTFTPSAGFTVDAVNTTNGIVGNLAFANVSAVPGTPTQNGYIAINAKLYVPNEGDIMAKISDEDNVGIGNLPEFKIAVVKEDSTEDLAIRVKEAEKIISFDGGDASQFDVKNFKEVTGARKLVISIDNEGAKFKDEDTGTPTNGTQVIIDGTRVNGKAVNGVITLQPADLTGKKTVVVIPKIAGMSRKATEGDLTITAAVTETVGTTERTVTSNTATIGKIVDFGVTLTVVEVGKKEIPSVWGGNKAKVRVMLKGPKGSLIDRAIDFKVDGATPMFTTATGFSGERASQDNTKPEYNHFKDGEFSFYQTGFPTKDKVEFTLEIVTDADKDGVATITAAQRGWEQKADLAKVTPKFQIKADMTQVKKGERKAVADVTLTEAKAGLLAKNDKIKLHFSTRSQYVAFAAKVSSVEVTNGLKLDLDNINFKSADGTYVEYTVTKSSAKEPAVITFKDIKVLVDGSATDSSVQLRASLNGDLVHKIDYITVVKEYALGANKSVFTIGSTSYKVDAMEKSLQVAPYIKNGRVMLPIRAVAEALGLNVQWNPATKTATFADATKTAAVVIGSETIYVNGTPIKLSAKAELVQGTTFVELKSLASAFGVDIKWDNAAKTATVSR